MDLGLEGKVAIVTGASRGIGKAIALELAKEKANVVVTGIDQSYDYLHLESRGKDLRIKELEEVAKEIRSLGRKSLAIRTDVSKSDDVEKMVQKTREEFGRIDILVQNAGVALSKAFDETTEAEWDFQQEINLKGVWLGAKAVAPIMKKQGSGKIVNISSLAGKTGYAFWASYGAAKAGVINFTQTLANELGPFNIQVNCVCPGIVGETGLGDASLKAIARVQGVTPDGVRTGTISMIPTRRLTSTLDIAHAVCFLASDKSNQINGQAINVCGGVEKH